MLALRYASLSSDTIGVDIFLRKNHHAVLNVRI